MGDDPERDKIDVFAARIRQAEAKPKNETSGAAPPMKMSRVGFDFMGTIIASALVGWLVDKEFGTKPWGILIMLLIGFAGGIVNVWRALGSSKE